MNLDPARRSVEEIATDGWLAARQAIVGGWIEAVYLADGRHDCCVNEEGLLHGPQHFLLPCDTPQPIEEVRRRVRFFDGAEVQPWLERSR